MEKGKWVLGKVSVSRRAWKGAPAVVQMSSPQNSSTNQCMGRDRVRRQHTHAHTHTAEKRKRTRANPNIYEMCERLLWKLWDEKRCSLSKHQWRGVMQFPHTRVCPNRQQQRFCTASWGHPPRWLLKELYSTFNILLLLISDMIRWLGIHMLASQGNLRERTQVETMQLNLSISSNTV